MCRYTEKKRGSLADKSRIPYTSTKEFFVFAHIPKTCEINYKKRVKSAKTTEFKKPKKSRAADEKY